MVQPDALLGPVELPGGSGTLTQAQKQLIYDATGCSANVRQRRTWHGRCLTIVGPPEALRMALQMGFNYVAQNEGPQHPQMPSHQEPPPPPLQASPQPPQHLSLIHI